MAFLEYLKQAGDAVASVFGKPSLIKDSTNNVLVLPKATADGTQYVLSQDYLLAMAEGDIPNHTLVFKGIYITSVNVGTTPTLISSVYSGTTYSEQSSGATRSVQSTSSSDDPTGTGIRSVRITYISSTDGTEKTTDVTMGVGGVYTDTSVNDILHVNMFEALTVGSAGVAVGTIRLYTASAAGGTVFTHIPVGDTQSRCANYYVPSDKTAYIITVPVTFKSTSGYFKLMRTNSNSLFCEHNRWGFSDRINNIISIPIVIPGGGKIEAYYTGITSNEILTVSFVGWTE